MTDNTATRLVSFEVALAHRDPGPLHRFLVESGATRVEPIRVAAPPPDRRDAPGLDVAAFAVSLIGSAAQVVDLCRSWLAQRRPGGATSITLVIDGDTIEVTTPSTRTEDALVEAFIARHSRP